MRTQAFALLLFCWHMWFLLHWFFMCIYRQAKQCRVFSCFIVTSYHRIWPLFLSISGVALTFGKANGLMKQSLLLLFPIPWLYYLCSVSFTSIIGSWTVKSPFVWSRLTQWKWRRLKEIVAKNASEGSAKLIWYWKNIASWCWMTFERVHANREWTKMEVE